MRKTFFYGAKKITRLCMAGDDEIDVMQKKSSSDIRSL